MGVGTGAEFRLPVATPGRLDIGALAHYWNPDRDGVERPDPAFQHQLNLIHPDLAVVRPPPGAPIAKRKWLVWYRKPSITHKLCPGWLLLFIWPPEPYDPIPLDNRVFANLYLIDARQFGSGVEYFDRIVKGMEADRDRKAARDKAYRDDRVRDYWQSTQIKNIGAGNKFALHHDGTIIPGRGDAAWAADRVAHVLPSEVINTRGRR